MNNYQTLTTNRNFGINDWISCDCGGEGEWLGARATAYAIATKIGELTGSTSDEWNGGNYGMKITTAPGNHPCAVISICVESNWSQASAS